MFYAELGLASLNRICAFPNEGNIFFDNPISCPFLIPFTPLTFLLDADSGERELCVCSYL